MKNPNELSAASSLRGDELQLIEQKASIVVGIANSRTNNQVGFFNQFTDLTLGGYIIHLIL